MIPSLSSYYHHVTTIPSLSGLYASVTSTLRPLPDPHLRKSAHTGGTSRSIREHHTMVSFTLRLFCFTHHCTLVCTPHQSYPQPIQCSVPGVFFVGGRVSADVAGLPGWHYPVPGCREKTNAGFLEDEQGLFSSHAACRRQIDQTLIVITAL